MIGENLVVAGRLVTVGAEVDGDVVAAGKTVSVGDRIRGDVLAAGETVSVHGTVDGDVRVAGRVIQIDADVAGDTLAAAAQDSVSMARAPAAASGWRVKTYSSPAASAATCASRPAPRQ